MRPVAPVEGPNGKPEGAQMSRRRLDRVNPSMSCIGLTLPAPAPVAVVAPIPREKAFLSLKSRHVVSLARAALVASCVYIYI